MSVRGDGKFLLGMREKPGLGGGIGFVMGEWYIFKAFLAFPS